MRIIPGRRDDDDRAAPDPMAGRLTIELQDLASGGEAHVDVSSVLRLGSERLRRRRNLTAGGVAVGVVALVIGGTIVGRPAPTGVQTGGSRVVPVCSLSTVPSPVPTSPHLIGSGETGSPTDEGSSAPATPTPAAIASREQAARKSAQSAAASAASAAERARSAAESSVRASIAATALSPGATYQWVMSVQSVPWFTTPKGLQLTDALRAAVPAGVEVLKGDDSWLEFEGGTRGTTTYAISAAGANPQVSASAVPLTPEPDTPVQIPMVSAGAAVFKTNTGWGTLQVGVGDGTGTPPCIDAGIERRLVEKDGTVVDVGVLTNTLVDAGQWLGSLSVTAYRTDGTVVTATVSTSGTVAELPMTADELIVVATAPGLEVSAPATPAQSSLAARITTDQNGVVSTLPSR